MRRHDWTQIRHEYVEGVPSDTGFGRHYPSHDELSKKFDVYPSMLKSRSAKENWSESRAEFRSKLSNALQQKTIKNSVAESRDFDNKCLNLAKTLLTMINNDIAKAVQQNRELTLTAKAQLAEILRKCQYVGRLALGQSTENLNDVTPRASFSIAGREPATIDQKPNENSEGARAVH